MPTCTVMVGLPALGKSTFIKKLKTEDVWIYSTDMYIDAVAEDNGITYSEAFASNIDAATKFNEQKLKTMINLGRDVIWDQTNLSVKKRKTIISKFSKTNYIFDCICIEPPEPGHFDDLKTWKQRLNSRPGKVIPENILSNMYKSYTEPTLDEGFEKITFYSMFGVKLRQLSK